MLRRLATVVAFAFALPLSAHAEEANGFRFAGVSLETGGFPRGEQYNRLSGTAHADYGLGWADLGIDLTLSTARAGEADLSTAKALFHLTTRPLGDGFSVGPYLWLGSQSEGGAAFAIGGEAAVHLPSGFGAELYFGETRGGALGVDGYATNRGLRVSYTGQGRFSGYGAFSKDTLNMASGDQDFYRLAFGLDTWLDLPAAGTSGRAALLSVAVGQHHFDLLDERENWVSVGLTIPLTQGRSELPVFSSRRAVTHNLPLP
ncbi:hypothetical protein FHY55_00740 [Oceanicola sp. D3]|uniref:hypothetical protein n=1 Tax=Oceanicola sp. D3 TaxID=2587163 RepID=UPI00111D212F|nr:hypothetical protein [Oceanicola sp. D3]QDC07859.1 hypothetical protein FHY55_00740 [Oceanicola sp. D3]